MNPIEGKQTLETVAATRGITRQSAANLLVRLKKRGLVRVSGGGRQKRIYTITRLPTQPTNGFYDVVNRYGDEKLVPRYAHYVHGRYGVEDAIVDGLRIGDERTRAATMRLFNHVTNYPRLLRLAKKKNVDVKQLYERARAQMKVRRMRAR
jgi:hypothetical protein